MARRAPKMNLKISQSRPCAITPMRSTWGHRCVWEAVPGSLPFKHHQSCDVGRRAGVFLALSHLNDWQSNLKMEHCPFTIICSCGFLWNSLGFQLSIFGSLMIRRFGEHSWGTNSHCFRTCRPSCWTDACAASHLEGSWMLLIVSTTGTPGTHTCFIIFEESC